MKVVFGCSSTRKGDGVLYAAQIGRTKDSLRITDEGPAGMFVNNSGPRSNPWNELSSYAGLPIR